MDPRQTGRSSGPHRCQFRSDCPPYHEGSLGWDSSWDDGEGREVGVVSGALRRSTTAVVLPRLTWDPGRSVPWVLGSGGSVWGPMLLPREAAPTPRKFHVGSL